MGIADSLPVGSTFDLAAPRRPALADLLADQKQDDAAFPPGAGMPAAQEFNNIAATVAAVAKIIANAKVSVYYAYGGAPPSLRLFTAASDNVSAATFTIARTPGGAATGDVTITWPASTFPGAAAYPEATVNGTVPGPICANPVANGVRIVTQSTSGAPTDLPFTVSLN